MTQTHRKRAHWTQVRHTESFSRALQRIVVAAATMGGLPACHDGGSDAVEPSQTAISDAGAAPPDPCAPAVLNTSLFEEAGSTCALFMDLPCGLPPEASVSTGCSLDPVTCRNACQTDLLFGCELASVSCDDGGAAADAALVVDCVVCANGIGRRPRGLRCSSRRRAKAPALGAYFAQMAHLEAASVTAFGDLRRSLDALGAPRALRRAATRAMADERRHAFVTGHLARRFGGRPERPRVSAPALPSLTEFLADNVVEGCVGESYGALVALWQGARAGDASVRAAMRTLARDEARHASLAWMLLRWGAQRVDARTRRALQGLVAEALKGLRESAERRVDPAVECTAGHPSPDVARVLFAQFEALVLRWSHDALAEVRTASTD